MFLLWINLNFQRCCCSQFFHLNFGKGWSLIITNVDVSTPNSFPTQIQALLPDQIFVPLFTTVQYESLLIDLMPYFFPTEHKLFNNFPTVLTLFFLFSFNKLKSCLRSNKFETVFFLKIILLFKIIFYYFLLLCYDVLILKNNLKNILKTTFYFILIHNYLNWFI